MSSLPKVHPSTLLSLVLIAALSSAGEPPRHPGDASGRRDPTRLRFSALPGEESSFGFEIDLGRGRATSEAADAPERRPGGVPGGLELPWDTEPWPELWEPPPESDSYGPVERRERRQDARDWMGPLERPRDDRRFADFLRDRFDVEDSEEDAAGLAGWMSSGSLLDRLWSHERDLWSLHIYGGQNFTDTLAEVVRGETHPHSSSLGSVGVVRHGGAFFSIYEDAWWWPTWEIEYTFTRRFENNPFNEHNVVPLRARWDLPLGKTAGRYMELSFAVSEGVSLAENVPNVEVSKREESHQLQNFLAFDVIVGLPFLEKYGSFARSTNLFFRIHHRSDVYGLYPEQGGSNTLTVGVSLGRRRTAPRWQKRPSGMR